MEWRFRIHECDGSVFGRHRQYSLYKVSASRVLRQFAWEGFWWCCGRPRQVGGDFFTNQIPKLFLRLAVRPFGSEEDLVQPLSTIPMPLKLLAPLLPAEPLPELSLLEGDLRALGQPMSSILELGIDLAHLNCTLQPYYFQPLVT